MNQTISMSVATGVLVFAKEALAMGPYHAAGVFILLAWCVYWGTQRSMKKMEVDSQSDDDKEWADVVRETQKKEG